MSRLTLVFIAVCVALSVALVLADEEKKPKYVGMKGCKGCHGRDKIGNQYKIWSEGPHAKTYTQLGEKAGKEVAEKAGVKGDPQKAKECLECHVTAYGVDKEQLDKGYKAEEGVTCEACHGPGEKYKRTHIKKKDDAKKQGFVLKPDEKSCKVCHNKKSPTYKEFKYDEKVKKIAHPKK
jgi:hypothetical protein